METCRLINCMFCHDYENPLIQERTAVQPNLSQIPSNKDCVTDIDRPAKRRRIQHFSHIEAPAVQSSVTTRKNPEQSSVGPVTKDVSPPPLRNAGRHPQKAETSDSQPAGQGPFSKKVESRTQEKGEPLLPRSTPKPPASHALRLKLIKLLHEQIVRLNKEVIASNDEFKDALELSGQEMVSFVLDEELKAAREAPAVYANVLKMRIGALKKMKLEAWKTERMLSVAKSQHQQSSSNVTQAVVSLESSLSTKNQIEILMQWTAKLSDLTRFGYVAEPPNGADIELARQGVEAIRGWEQCDRCNTRFQVFPGRREEDGALTTGGGCNYHYGKAVRPKREKTDLGFKEATYACCSQAQGTPGCTQASSHVFKVSEAKRLAMVMPFIETPGKGSRVSSAAICFDCEMGYTTFGMELTRLTATSWPDGKMLIDLLVRPLGEVLDLNSRFSGVWPRHYEEIPRHGSSVPESANSEGELRLVESPHKARELFLQFLARDTPLMGHALENDLNAVRLIHPIIIDTVLLYPHPRGLPIRHGLKVLVQRHLNRNIQMGGAQGHDSKEDAQAAGDLIRLRVRDAWKEMKRTGWRLINGDFLPPPSAGTAPRSTAITHRNSASK